MDRVVNAASGSVEGACSPGAIARIEGRWLAQAETATDPSGGSLELAGTSVEVEGKPVPILYASPSRIDILCPEAGPASSFETVVRTAGLVSPSIQTAQNAVAPGIFTVDGSGSGQGLVSLDSESLDGESKLAMVRNYLSAAQPARPGDRIAILATGIGAAFECPGANRRSRVPGRVGGAGSWQGWGLADYRPSCRMAHRGNSVPLSIAGQLTGGSPARSNSVSLAIEEK